MSFLGANFIIPIFHLSFSLFHSAKRRCIFIHLRRFRLSVCKHLIFNTLNNAFQKLNFWKTKVQRVFLYTHTAYLYAPLNGKEKRKRHRAHSLTFVNSFPCWTMTLAVNRSSSVDSSSHVTLIFEPFTLYVPFFE